jgi:hypothetical protein
MAKKTATKNYLTAEHKSAIESFKRVFGVGNEVKLEKSVRVFSDSGAFGSGSDGYVSALRINPETKHIEYYLDFWCYGWHDGEVESEDYSNTFKDFGVRLIEQAIEELHTKNSAKSLDEAKRIDELLDKDDDYEKREMAHNQGLIPEDDFYMENEATFALWRLRKSDKPITYKMLYGVVEELLERIDRAESMARSAGWRE